jgi:hypothetical protein
MPLETNKSYTLKDLFAALSMLGIVAGTTLSEATPAQAQETRQQIPKEKYPANMKVLRTIADIMDNQRSRIAPLKPGVGSEPICKFNQEWTQHNRAKLETIWNYIQKNEASLPKEVREAFTEFLKISMTIKTDWSKKFILFHPIKKLISGHMITSEAELKDHVQGYFKKKHKVLVPANPGESECSFLFNDIFTTITTDFPQAVPQAQDASAKFIKGVALLIGEKIQNGTKEEIDEAIRMSITLGEIIFSAAKQN